MSERKKITVGDMLDDLGERSTGQIQIVVKQLCECSDAIAGLVGDPTERGYQDTVLLDYIGKQQRILALLRSVLWDETGHPWLERWGKNADR